MQAATGRKHAGHLTGSTCRTGCETAGPCRDSRGLISGLDAIAYTLPEKPVVRKWYFQF
jgi:hypothetical protein